jgi:hypothetical protein
VKRRPHLQALSDDHCWALALARRVWLAAEPDPEREALTHTCGELRRLFVRELELHFLQLKATGEHALVERARADHARLRALVHTESDPVVTAQFAELLRHARFEAAGRAALAAREA